MRGFQSCVEYLLLDPAVGGIGNALKLALKYEEDPTPIVELIMSDRYQRLSYDHMQDIISRHGAEFRDELLTRLFVIQHEAEEAAQAEAQAQAYAAAVEAAPDTLPPDDEEWGGMEMQRQESPYSLELAQRQYESAGLGSRSRSRSRSRPRSQTAVAPPRPDSGEY